MELDCFLFLLLQQMTRTLIPSPHQVSRQCSICLARIRWCWVGSSFSSLEGGRQSRVGVEITQFGVNWNPRVLDATRLQDNRVNDCKLITTRRNTYNAKQSPQTRVKTSALTTQPTNCQPSPRPNNMLPNNTVNTHVYVYILWIPTFCSPTNCGRGLLVVVPRPPSAAHFLTLRARPPPTPQTMARPNIYI